MDELVLLSLRCILHCFDHSNMWNFSAERPDWSSSLLLLLFHCSRENNFTDELERICRRLSSKKAELTKVCRLEHSIHPTSDEKFLLETERSSWETPTTAELWLRLIITLHLTVFRRFLKIHSRPALNIFAGRRSRWAGAGRGRGVRDSVHCWSWRRRGSRVLEKELLNLKNVNVLLELVLRRRWDQSWGIRSVTLGWFEVRSEQFVEGENSYLTDIHCSCEPDVDSSNALNCYHPGDCRLCSCYAVYCCCYCSSYHFRDA